MIHYYVSEQEGCEELNKYEESEVERVVEIIKDRKEEEGDLDPTVSEEEALVELKKGGQR